MAVLPPAAFLVIIGAKIGCEVRLEGKEPVGGPGGEGTMRTPRSKRGVVLFLVLSVLLALACSITTAAPPAVPPTYDPTKAALEMQATFVSMQLTQGALVLNPQAGQPVAENPTDTPEPPAQPPSPTPIPVIPTEDIEARIRSANVLVYENTDERGIGMWVQDALDAMGMKYTQTGSYSGHFMEYLGSGTPYDLIIVDAEDKDTIRGEFWDVINTRLTRDKAAMIAEIWYLDLESTGPVAKILGQCGVRFRKDLPLADSVYWWQPQHPVFNEPNTVLPLLHYSRFWGNQAGDKLMMGSGGDATFLAGLSAQSSPGEGVIATCYGGRVIIQTFSDHDYHQSDIIALWQNYIHWTLKNHFEALQ